MKIDRPEGGFTLVEMLVTVVILGIAIAPITASIFVGMRTESDVQTYLTQNNGAHLFNSYFGPDVQNALAVGLNQAEPADACGASAATVALLLRDPFEKTSVSYFIDPANPHILRRRECAGGAPVGPPAGTPVIRNLDAAHPPAFSCAPAADCSSWISVSATVRQLGTNGRNPFATTLRAGRRVL